MSKVLVSGRDLWLCLFDFWKFFDFELERKVVLLLLALQAYTHNKNIIMLFTKEHTHVPIHTDFFAILIWSLNSNTSFFPYWEHSFTWTTLFYGHTRYTSTLSVSKKTFLSIFNIFLQRGRKATGSPYHTTTLYTPTSTTVLSPLAPWDSLACTLYMTLPPPGGGALPLTLDKVEEVTHVAS